MRFSRILPVGIGRLMFVAAGLVAFVGVSKAFAQTTPPAAPAQAPAPAEDKLKLTSDSAMIIYVIKPDKSADFEAVWAQIKQLYATVDDPDLKAVGASIQLFKPASPSAAGVPTNYMFIIESVVKAASYDPSKVIYFVKPGPDANTPGTMLIPRADADALYKKLGDCIQQLSIAPLAKVG